MSAHPAPPRGGGVFSTLLMTAPLLVVPALAALGLPEAASDPAPNDDFTLELPDAAGEEQVPGDGTRDLDPAPAADSLWALASRDAHEDPSGTGAFADSEAQVPEESSADAAAQVAANTTANPFASSETAAPVRTAELENRPRGSAVGAAPGEFASFDESNASEAADERSSGALRETALHIPDLTAELRAIGATDLTLSAGAESETWYFGCSLQTNEEPKVVRRFEAEAASPAAAVRAVLRQVREYRGTAPTSPQSVSAR